jgi:citrate synthase
MPTSSTVHADSGHADPSRADSGRAEEHLIEVPRGLKGVIVAETELGYVRGLEGFYHYRQYSAVDLAEQRSIEDVWLLLFDGELPSRRRRAEFAQEIRSLRTLPEPVVRALPAIAAGSASPLDGLRTALSLAGSARGLRPLMDLTPDQRRSDALYAAAITPVLLTSLYRLMQGQQPIPPHPDLDYVANYLYMLTGTEAEPKITRAIEQYLISTIDHGFNASTFTARVIASTGADLVACLVGAIGSLSGPLHGGAPSRALDTLDAIGTLDRVDAWITERVTGGERIMGFGHPIYRTEDPRSRMLREIAETFGGERVDLAVQIERRVVELLAELKPGRELHTNVEFYAGVVMELCGLPRAMFTPTFASSRVIGWCANVLEQSRDTKIIRPSSRYVGPPPPAPIPAQD